MYCVSVLLLLLMLSCVHTALYVFFIYLITSVKCMFCFGFPVFFLLLYDFSFFFFSSHLTFLLCWYYQLDKCNNTLNFSSFFCLISFGCIDIQIENESSGNIWWFTVMHCSHLRGSVPRKMALELFVRLFYSSVAISSDKPFWFRTMAPRPLGQHMCRNQHSDGGFKTFIS